MKITEKEFDKVCDAYSRINNTVVGSEEHGILICDESSNYALPLNLAFAAMKKGEDAMDEALTNDSIDLGADFEL